MVAMARGSPAAAILGDGTGSGDSGIGMGGDAAGAGRLPAARRRFRGGALAIAQPGGWLPPFIAFGSLLLGLIWFQVWALRHRHDDD